MSLWKAMKFTGERESPKRDKSDNKHIRRAFTDFKSGVS